MRIEWSKALSAALLAGSLLCPAGVATAQEKTLTIGYTKTPLQDSGIVMFEKWAAANGVKLVKVPMAYNVFLEKVTATLTSQGDQFDIIWVNDDWGQLWAKWLEPVGDLKAFNEFDPEPVNAAFLNEARQPTAVPIGYAVMSMIYRTDLVPENKVPKTWDELVAVSQELQKAGKVKWGFVGGMQMNHNWHSVFWSAWSNNCDVFAPPLERDEAALRKNNYKNMLTDACQLETANFWWDALHTNKISPPGMTAYTRDDSAAIFRAGDAAFMVNSATMMGDLNDAKKSKVAGHVQLASFPRGPRLQKHIAAPDIWAWAIPKGAKPEQKKLAKQALDAMLLDVDGQVTMWKTTGSPPPSKKAWDVIAKEDPQFAVIRRVVFDQELKTHGAYYSPQWPNAQRAYTDAMSQALAGKREDIPARLAEGSKTIDAIMAKELAPAK